MGSSALVNGHTNGWHCQVRFNFFASQLLNGTVTTFYLQYNSSNGSYYWIPEIDWRPLGTESPNYKIKSRQLVESNYVGFEEQIPFVDDSGNAISMLGDWDFFLDIQKYGTTGSNPGSFICNFLGYGYQIRQFKPQTTIGSIPNPSGSGSTTSGTVSWSNTLEIPGTTNFSILPFSQLGFNAGTSTLDIRLITSSPFRGVLQALNTTAAATYGISLNTQIDNNTNTERYSFGTLLWGDAVQSFAIGALRVNTGTAFDKTDADGEWGRGILTGDKTFTELLIHEFLTGQLEVVISPSMRLVVGDSNKDVTISGVTRPRFVNPIGILRETRNGPDPVYFFRRGSFYSLYDEWDYEGYQILRDLVTSTTTTNDIGDLGGSQDSNPVSAAKIIGNVTDALSTNSTIASLRQTIASTGANVAVNGNFNVATGWTLGTGWSIDTTAQKAKFAATGSLSSLSQINLTEGTKYQVIFTIDITAGQLTVKAGTSGGSQVITVAGQYELYLLCEGSTSIVFQAGTTFTGSISQVSIADQKSLSSVPIESLGEAVFKTNDTFNLVNSINGEVIPLTVTSNQGATDTAISVTSVPLFDDIGIDSVLLINQDDLSAQYQNKTKGTVAGFDITATGIEKSSINITDWLNSDTMTGASVTNVPTALSVKNYVDGQVGASDTLQEVTDNGNTTTNSITIGNAASPNNALEVYGNADNGVARFRHTSNGAYGSILLGSVNRLIGDVGTYMFKNGSSELMRITSGGNVLIGTTSDGGSKLQVTSNLNQQHLYIQGGYAEGIGALAQIKTTANGNALLVESATTSDSREIFEVKNSNGTVFKVQGNGDSTFIGQVTIPATPVASTDAASKSYVDAQVGSADTLQEVTDNGNTTTNSIRIGSSSAPAGGVGLHVDTEIRVDGNDGVATKKIRSSYFSSSQNIIIESGSSASVIHNIGSTEKMRLNSTGLGIGTTSVSYPLHVVTNSSSYAAYFKNSNNNGGGVVIAAANGGGGTNPILDLRDSTDNVKVRVIESGNMLLGTTTDTGQKLQVSGSIKTTTAGTGLQFYGTGGSGNIDAFGSNNLILMTNSVERARITSGGNLLIGTTSDSGYKLSVNGTGSFFGNIRSGGGTIWSDSNGGVQLGYSSSDATGYLTTYYNTTSVVIGAGVSQKTGITINGSSASAGNQIIFRVGNSERARITSGGNLGIGTTSPDSLLEISSSSTSDFLKLTTAGGGANPIKLVFEKSSVEQGVIEYNRNGDLEIYNTDNDGGVMIDGSASAGGDFYVAHNGNVGIGNTSPSEKLHVVGDALITGDSHADAFKPADGGEPIKFKNFGNTEVARITGGGNLGVGESNPTLGKLQVNGNIFINRNGTNGLAANPYFENLLVSGLGTTNVSAIQLGNSFGQDNGTYLRFQVNSNSAGSTPVNSLILNPNGTATFSGQVTIPATPIATTDAASKSYVDAQVSATDSLQEVTTVGNTTTNSIMIGSSSSPSSVLHVSGGSSTIPTLSTSHPFTISNSSNSGMSIISGVGNAGQIVFGDASDADVGRIRYQHSDDSMRFWTNADERARITSGGNLLIGSTSDNGAKLQVTGGGTFSGDVTLDKSSGSSPSLNFINGSDDNGAILINSSGKIQIKTGGTVRQTISSGDTEFNGNIKLVNGSGNVTFASSSSDDLTVTSTTANFSGNLLIGTTTDSGDKLNINGSINIPFSSSYGYKINGNRILSQPGSYFEFGALDYKSIYPNISVNNDGTFRILFNGTESLRVSSNRNILIGSTSDNGQKLQVTGNVRITGSFQVANTGGFLLADTGGSMRYGLKYGAAGAVGSSNLLMLTNRSLSSATGGGEVAISANASTSGVTETEVMRIKANTQSQVSIDGVLSLTSQNTPADPPNRASTIWLDSNFDLKIKITNNSGVTVTKTLAEYA